MVPTTARRFAFRLGAVLLLCSGCTILSHAQVQNPCGVDQNPGPPAPSFLTQGLFPVGDGTIVYDANQQVCWLANANLASNTIARAVLGVPGIKPDGTMDYATALLWVAALNGYNHNIGYLGHHNWQLPDFPSSDPNCTSFNMNSFGEGCTASALGNLYNVGLERTFPDSVVPLFFNTVQPFENMPSGLYWTSDVTPPPAIGQETVSFNTGAHGANTPLYNYLHVLPMYVGSIGPPPAGPGIVPYTSGPAAGKAVYDTNYGTTWPLNANLAESQRFGVAGTTTITSAVLGTTITVPLIDAAGTMLLETAQEKGGWIDGMNKANFAGVNNWTLPTETELLELYGDLNPQVGDTRFLVLQQTGPFQRLQPFFYWGCERKQKGSSQSPCDPSLFPGLSPGANPVHMQWSFDMDNGFQGTDLPGKLFYVMVYYPAGNGG
jgi:hypothetical protein